MRFQAVANPIDVRKGTRDLPLLSVSQHSGVRLRNELTDEQERAEDLSNYKVVSPGNIVVNRMSAYQGALGLSARDGVCSPDYMVLQLRANQYGRFWHYYMRSRTFVAEMTARVRGIGNVGNGGVRTPRISYQDMKAINVPNFSRSRQQLIAEYLDRETATIDALIEKQRALVGALRERRSAAIEHALEAAADRGLLLKRLVSRVDQGISPDTSSATGLEDIWVLKSGASNDGFFNEEASKPVPESVTVPLGIELHEGDLVVSRASGSPRLVGSAALVGQLSRRLVLSDKNFRLVPSQNVWVRYLYWALNSQIYREQVLRSISGAEGLANNLPLSKLMNFTVPVPPLEEQREIADHLDRETAKIDALIAKAEQFIELAQERRAALITAAVTGQIEIPTED
ncbi:hypothetical protein GQ85_12795 [Rhodococcus rhodochrous]|nr:hypothetical protein GQ85_12795 [Rhodococcus rhodochrous]